jgi:hypothetical protein
MLRSVSVTAILLASATPRFGPTRDENAVKAAGDAFGTSVGNERIGLYNAGDVRGFSPITAGNIRIEGLSVTEHGGFTSRVVSGSTIRVGLTAQGYPFPGPTGIADYSLRNSGNEAVLSPVLYLGPNGAAAAGGRRSAPDRSRSAQPRGWLPTATRRISRARTAGEDARQLQAEASCGGGPAMGSRSSPSTGARSHGRPSTSPPSSPPGLICPRRSSAAISASTGPSERRRAAILWRRGLCPAFRQLAGSGRPLPLGE